MPAYGRRGLLGGRHIDGHGINGDTLEGFSFGQGLMRSSPGPEGPSNAVQLGLVVGGRGQVQLVEQGARAVAGEDVLAGIVMEQVEVLIR